MRSLLRTGRTLRALALALTTLGVGVMLAAPARAATLTWWSSGSTGSVGGTGTWDTSALRWTADGSTWQGWNNSASPLDAAWFGGTAGTVTLNTGITTNGLTFATTGYTVTGNTITLAGSTPTITTDTGVTGTIASILAGSAGMTKSGAGTLVLTAANTYTGTTTISQGTLQVGNGGTTGSLASASVVNNAGLVYTFSSGGSFTLPSGSIAGSGNLSGTAGFITLQGSVTQGGSISLVQNGNTTLYNGISLTGANTITGSSITINADIGKRSSDGNSLALDTSAANGPMSLNVSLGRAGRFYVPTSFTANSGTGTISVVGTGPSSSGWRSTPVTLTGRLSITTNVASGTTVTLNEVSATGTASGVWSDDNADGGRMSLVKGGTGTLTFTGGNTFTGNMSIMSGTVVNTVSAGSSNPTATGLGNMTTNGRTITTGTGATLQFNNSNSMGAYTYKTPVTLIADGGTITSLPSANQFNTFGDIQLKNGGRLTTTNGGASNFQSFAINGDVTVSGTSGSFIDVLSGQASNTGINLGTTTGTTTFTVAATGDPTADLTVSASLLDKTLGGAAAIVKTGSGRMVLIAANAYTGTTTISQGTLQVGNGGATGSLASTGIVNNGNLVYSLSSAGSFTVPSGSITGSGNLSGTAGYITLNGNVTQGGSISLVQNGSGGGLYNGISVGASNSTITGSSITIVADIGKQGSVGNSLALDTSAVNGPMSLNFSLGRGNVFYSMNSFTANSGTGTISLVGTGTSSAGWTSTPVTLTGRMNITTAISSNSGVTLNETTTTGTVSGALSGAMSLVSGGTGTLTLTAANTYSGSTTISQGTLQVGNGGTTGSLASSVIVNNSNLVYNFSSGGGFSLPSGSITGSGNLSGTAGFITLQGSVTQGGSISLVQNGNTTLSNGISLTGANTITGSSITINADVGKQGSNGNSLALDTSAANGPMSLNVSLGRNGRFYVPTSFTANSGTGTISVVGTGPSSSGWRSTPVTLTGRLSITTNVASGTTVTLNEVSATGTASGVLSDDTADGGRMSLVKGGTGTLTLTATSSFTGATIVRAGTLVAAANGLSAANGVFGNATSAIVVGDGSTGVTDAPTMLIGGLFTVGRAITVGSVSNANAYTPVLGGANTSGTATYSGAITLSTTASGYTGLVLQAAPGGTVDFTGAWTTNNKVVTVGSAGNTGTVRISSALPTTGGVTVSAGTLLVGSASALGSTTPVTLAAATTLDAAGFAATIGTLSGSGTITGTTGGVLTVTQAANTTYAGSVDGSVGLTKAGASTLTLSNVNSYSGATTVNTGTLALAAGASIGSSAVTVANAAVLAGSGTAGATTVLGGGILTPGVSGVGTLTLSSLTFGTAAGNTATVSIPTTGLASIPATLQVNGNVVANGGAGSVTFAFGSLANVGSGTYGLISYTGSLASGTSPFTYTGQLSGRQGIGFDNTAGVLSLVISNAFPIWSGSNGTGWSTANNWTLNTDGQPTGFQALDTVVFNDTGVSGTVTITGSNVNPAATTFNGNSLAYTVDATGGFGITGAGNLVKSGSATVTIANTNSFSGGTQLSAGTLIVTGSGALGSGAVTVSGGQLSVTGGGSLGSAAVTLASGTVQVGGDAALGTGTLSLNGGTLSSDSASARSLANAVTFGGNATLGSAANSGNLTLSGSVNLGGATRQLTIASPVTISGVVSGGGITKAGDSTLTLSASNSFAGGVTLSAGTLRMGNDAALGSGALALNSGVLSSDSTTARSIGNATTVGGDVTLGDATNSGTLTFTAGVNLGGAARQITTPSNVTFAGAVSNGVLVKSGAGRLTLTGTNTYTSGTVSQGVLQVNGTSSLPGAVSIASGATLYLNQGGVTWANSMTGSGTATLFLSAAGAGGSYVSGLTGFNGTLAVANNGNTGDKLAFYSTTAMPGTTLAIDPGSTLYVDANPTVPTVTFGSIRVSGTGNNENRGAIRLASGTIAGPITLLGSTVFTGGGTFTGSITSGVSGTSVLMLGTVNQSSAGALGGAISDGSGPVGITVAYGSVTLSGSNSYTGPTTINAGATLVAGNASALGSAAVPLTLANGTLNLNGYNVTRTGAVSFTGATVQSGTLTNNTVAFDGQSGSVSSVLAGSGGLTKTTAGTLTLTGANTYTGTTTISQGTLHVGNGGTTGSLASASVVNNASLVYNFSSGGGFSLPSGSITGSGNLSGTAGFITLQGSVTQGGSISLVQNGNTTLYNGISLTGANTITASSITINADIGKQGSDGNSLALDTSAANGLMSLNFSLGRNGRFYIPTSFTANSGTGTISVVGTGPSSSGWRGTPVTLTGRLSITANVSSGTTVTLNEVSATGTASGVWSNDTTDGGRLSLVMGGTGTLTLAAASTYTGSTAILAGTLKLGLNNAIPGASAITLGSAGSSATLDLDNHSLALSSLTFSGQGGTLPDSGGSVTLQNLSTGTARINVLSGTANEFHPNVTLSSTTVIDVSSNASLLLHATLGSGTTTVYTGATLDFNNRPFVGSYVLAGGNAINLASGTTTVTISGASTISGTSTAVDFLVTSTGSAAFDLALSGSSQVTIDLGGQARFNQSVAGLVDAHGASVFAGNVLAGANVQVGQVGQSGATASFAGDVAHSSSVTVNAGAQATFTGTAAGSIATTGTVVLSGRVTSTGGLTINSGGVAQILEGAVYDSTDIENAGSLVVNRTTNLTLAAAIDGVGSLTKQGASTLTLTGSSGYTGGTTLTAGTIALSGVGTLGGQGPVSLAAGTVLDLSGADGNRSIGTLSGLGNVTLGGNTLRTTVGGYSTFDGAIFGSGGFTKAGTDTLRLTGSQAFTGTATIEQGTLVLGTGNGNALASASRIFVADGAYLDTPGLTVVNNQTLGGYGTVYGDVTLNPGAIVSPGGSIGNLTIAYGGVTFSGTSGYKFEMTNATTGTAGTGWDLLTVTSLTITSTPADPFRILLTSLLSGTDQTPGTMTPENWDPDTSRSWLFVDAADPITGFDPAAFTFNYTGFLNTQNGEFSVALGTAVDGGDSSQLYIVYAAVPEPGTLALAGIGVAGVGLAAVRRRRSRRQAA